MPSGRLKPVESLQGHPPTQFSGEGRGGRDEEGKKGTWRGGEHGEEGGGLGLSSVLTLSLRRSAIGWWSVRLVILSSMCNCSSNTNLDVTCCEIRLWNFLSINTSRSRGRFNCLTTSSKAQAPLRSFLSYKSDRYYASPKSQLSVSTCLHGVLSVVIWGWVQQALSDTGKSVTELLLL